MTRTKNSNYRQRGYNMPDGSLSLVYGDMPAPVGGVVEFDHDVVELITITDHVEPAPADPAPVSSAV